MNCPDCKEPMNEAKRVNFSEHTICALFSCTICRKEWIWDRIDGLIINPN